jgi:hypothetical protein
MVSPVLAPRMSAETRFAAVLLALGIGAAACSGGGSPASQTTAAEQSTEAGATSGSPTTSLESPAATTSGGNGLENAPFEITHDWSNLPPSVQLDPPMKTEEECLTQPFWQDEEGKRAPVAQEDPLVVYADGRCNSPVTDTRIGGYAMPEQVGPAQVVLENGDAIGLECQTDVMPDGRDAQFIQDIRGPLSGSTTWVGGVVLQNGELDWALFPKTNVGFPNVSGLTNCY